MQPAATSDLKHASVLQAETMADIQKMFHVSDAQLSELVTKMGEEMKVGLTKDDASDLKMIPSFVTGKTYSSQSYHCPEIFDWPALIILKQSKY